MKECELHINYLEHGVVIYVSTGVGFISDEWIYVKVRGEFVAVKKKDTMSGKNSDPVFKEAIHRTMIVDSKTGLKDKRIQPLDKFSDKVNLPSRIEDYINRRMSALCNS